MYYIDKTFNFEAGHRLMNYEGKCKNLHGHSYQVQVTLMAESLDGRGFVADFSDVKKILMPVFDSLDHAMILCQDDEKFITLLSLLDQKIYLLEKNPTAENIAKHLFDIIVARFSHKSWLIVDSVEVQETPTSIATYSNWNF